jgi:heat shock protein HslJ
MGAVVLVAVVGALAACSSGSSGSDLVGPTWQWNGGSTKQPAHQFVVPDPQNYTITFADDGTFQAKADCNQVHGSYTTSGDSLKLEPGASTLVACGPDSQGDQFVALLSTVGSFKVDGSDLTMTLLADAGELQFSQA